MPRSSRDIIRLLERDGRRLDRVRGSHHIYKHPVKRGSIPVPHPTKEMKAGTERAILRSAGLL